MKESDMNRMIIAAAIAATALAGVVGPAQAAAWRVKAAQGDRAFVVVDPAQQANTAVLKEAVNSVCKPGKACVVMFWADDALAPTKMPLTAPQSKGVVAQYARNPVTGSSELLLRCKLGEETKKRCLK